jgi:putative heme iron utilization protein
MFLGALGVQILPLLLPSCRRAGYPFGTLVDFASDGAGLPIFCLSPLAIHARNLIEDPRCSLVVQMPGWTGLANARVTIFGDVYQLPPDMQVRGGRVGGG